MCCSQEGVSEGCCWSEGWEWALRGTKGGSLLAACSAMPARNAQHPSVQLLGIARLQCVLKPMRFEESRRLDGPGDIAQCTQKPRQQNMTWLARNIMLQHLYKTTGKE